MSIEHCRSKENQRTYEPAKHLHQNAMWNQWWNYGALNAGWGECLIACVRPSVRLSNHPSTHSYACQQHAKGTPYNELYSSIFHLEGGTAEGFINKFFSTTDRRQAGPTKSNDPQIDWQTDMQSFGSEGRHIVTVTQKTALR